MLAQCHVGGAHLIAIGIVQREAQCGGAGRAGGELQRQHLLLRPRQRRHRHRLLLCAWGERTRQTLRRRATSPSLEELLCLQQRRTHGQRGGRLLRILCALCGRRRRGEARGTQPTKEQRRRRRDPHRRQRAVGEVCRDARRPRAHVGVARGLRVLALAMRAVLLKVSAVKPALPHLQRTLPRPLVVVPSSAVGVAGGIGHRALARAMLADEVALVPVAVGEREHPLPVPSVGLVRAFVLLPVRCDVRASPVHLALEELARVGGAVRPAAQAEAGHLARHEGALVRRAVCQSERALAVHDTLLPAAIVLEVRVGEGVVAAALPQALAGGAGVLSEVRVGDRVAARLPTTHRRRRHGRREVPLAETD